MDTADFLLPLLLYGVAIPAIVAGIVLGPGLRIRRSDAGEEGSHWTGPLALGAAYVAGHAGVDGWPAFPPREAKDWIFVLAVAATAAGMLDAIRRGPGWFAVARRLLVSGAVPTFLLRRRIGSAWGPIEGWIWIAGLGLAVFAFWTNLRSLPRRVVGLSAPLVLFVAAAGGSAALALSGSALQGQLGGALASALAVGVVLEGLSARPALSPAAVAVPGVLLPALWISGAFHSELPTPSAALLAISPAGAWLAEASTVRAFGPRKAALVRLACVAAPAAAAVAISYAASPPIVF